MLLSHNGGRMSTFITVTTREWEYSQSCLKIVERLKKRIEKCDELIKREEANLKTQLRGFNEMSYRLIDKLVWEKTELQKIMEGKE